MDRSCFPRRISNHSLFTFNGRGCSLSSEKVQFVLFPPKAQSTESHSTSRENHEMGLTSVCCHDSAPAQNSQKNYYSVRGTPEDVLSLCCKNKPLKWRGRHKKHFVIPFFVPEAEPSLCASCVITRLKCPKKKKKKKRAREEKGKNAKKEKKWSKSVKK